MRWRANRSYSPCVPLRSRSRRGPVVVTHKTLTSGRKLNRLTGAIPAVRDQSSPFSHSRRMLEDKLFSRMLWPGQNRTVLRDQNRNVECNRWFIAALAGGAPKQSPDGARGNAITLLRLPFERPPGSCLPEVMAVELKSKHEKDPTPF